MQHSTTNFALENTADGTNYFVTQATDKYSVIQDEQGLTQGMKDMLKVSGKIFEFGSGKMYQWVMVPGEGDVKPMYKKTEVETKLTPFPKLGADDSEEKDPAKAKEDRKKYKDILLDLNLDQVLEIVYSDLPASREKAKAILLAKRITPDGASEEQFDTDLRGIRRALEGMDIDDKEDKKKSKIVAYFPYFEKKSTNTQEKKDIFPVMVGEVTVETVQVGENGQKDVDDGGDVTDQVAASENASDGQDNDKEEDAECEDGVDQ